MPMYYLFYNLMKLIMNDQISSYDSACVDQDLTVSLTAVRDYGNQKSRKYLGGSDYYNTEEEIQDSKLYIQKITNI